MTMELSNSRRKRKRRPTFTPRFGNSTVALEIGLLRMIIEQEKNGELLKNFKEGSTCAPLATETIF